MDTIAHKKETEGDNVPFRFIDRDKLKGRSTGRFNILRIGENSSYIYLEDWYHTISSLSTGKVILFIVGLYAISIIAWATLFYLFRDYGFVDITTFVAAMIMSLQTITTVGYSVTDINFGDHPIAFILLYGEMMQSILMNSFCIGIVYTRLSRAITRSRSIIFSDNAIIRKIDGVWCFVFQICELRRSQLIEAHISCYCVQKTVNQSSGVPFQMSRMELSHPQGSDSRHTVIMLPSVIVHPITTDSPLYPEIEYTEEPQEDVPSSKLLHRTSRCFTSSILDIPKPSQTSISELDTVWPCPICDEVFISQILVDQHVAREHSCVDSVRSEEEEANTPLSKDTIDRECLGDTPIEIKPELPYQLILDTIRKKDFEIIVLVEGIESVTSSKLQARYSYAADDIIANCTFKPCVSIGADGEAVIDFCKFHETVPIDPTKSNQDILFMQSIL